MNGSLQDPTPGTNIYGYGDGKYVAWPPCIVRITPLELSLLLRLSQRVATPRACECPHARCTYWCAKDEISDTQECAQIEGLSINNTPETTGVTAFHDEAAVCSVIPYQAPTVAFGAGTSLGQDLKEYFRRPRLVNTGSLATTNVNLVLRDLNRVVIFDTLFPGGGVRLDGVEGVRFDMVFTVTVAANPFHGGTIALSYQYDGLSTDPDQWCRARLSAACTNLPHVRLNVAEETMAQLTIPWLASVDYQPLTGTYDRVLGTLALNQIVPTPSLVSSPLPTYKLFIHLENLELIGATATAEQFVTPQSGLRTSQPSGVAAVLKEMKENRLLSRGLNAGSRVVSAVAGAVPSLAAIGGPLSWALRKAAGVASVFGYSKPRDLTLPSRVYRSDYIGEMNVDMPSAAYSLAVTAENMLRVDTTLTGSDMDDMSLTYITTKYSQINLTSLATTDVTGTRIWATLNCPMHFWYRTGGTKPFCNLAPPNAGVTSNVLYPSNLMYWGTMFRFWRGGIKYRFSFGKCKLHAGRVMVGFVPFGVQTNRNGAQTSSIPALEVAASLPQPFSYSATFDLKDASVFEFEVPYLSSFLWTTCNGYTGGVTMTVLDPLIANGEAASTIPLLIEVAGMDDFEFSCPCPSAATVATGNTGQTVFTQSGLNIDNSREVDEYTMGETIKSAKQLLMVPSSVIFDVTDSTESNTNLPLFSYLPRWTNAIPFANPSTNFFASSYQTLIAGCYAYWSGSTSYDVYADSESDRCMMQIAHNPADNGGVPGAARSLYSGGNRNQAVRLTTGRNALHAQVPCYGYFARIPVRDNYAAAVVRNFAPGATTMGSTYNYVVPVLRVRNTTGRPVRINLSISGGEDARFGVYLGPPLINLFNTLQTVSPEASPVVV